MIIAEEYKEERKAVEEVMVTMKQTTRDKVFVEWWAWKETR